MLGRSGLVPVILPLFQGTPVGVVFARSCMGILLGYKDEEHVPLAGALESGLLQTWYPARLQATGSECRVGPGNFTPSRSQIRT
jgi:hypothetical protein